MNPSRPTLVIILQALAASLVVLVAGCDSRRVDPPAASTSPAATVPGEVPIPSAGQVIDLDKAVDIVRAEVQGGEADSKAGPTPRSFQWQDGDPETIVDEPYDLAFPTGLERVATSVPSYNPMTVGRVELGKQLYYDPRISLDATVSCASCHDPAKGWTDNRRTSVGIDNHVGARNSPTILNTVLGRRSFFWDGRADSLETQVQGPIQNKIEMGDQSYRQIVERLRAIPGYRDQFRRVFGTEVTLDGLSKAVAAFERTALSGDSAFDRYDEAMRRDPGDPESARSLGLAEKRGMVLFGLPLHPDDPDRSQIAPQLTAKANCTKCHSGDTFADDLFHNTGVGFDVATGTYADLGRWVVAPIGTKSAAERGAFKTPTVRDVTRTAPYMHDGSEPTLEAVVDFYDRGGTKNPVLDPKMAPLGLTSAEKADLVAFMKALTGRSYPVAVPELPPGPDGKPVDPRAALNAPGGLATDRRPAPGSSDRAHAVAGLR